MERRDEHRRNRSRNVEPGDHAPNRTDARRGYRRVVARRSRAGYVSPPALFRSVLAVYGSGADQLYPVDAIGGIFDVKTIAPTPRLRVTAQQQYGTFEQSGTTLTATGTPTSCS